MDSTSHRAIRFAEGMRNSLSSIGSQLDSPARVTLAAELGEPLDGAWWPHASAVGRELPHLVAALKRPLGKVVDISVNWSSLAGMPNLDSMDWRGNSLVSLREARRQRVITLIGRRAKAHLLVIPPRTSTALAVMLLRRSARLPILSVHRDTDAFRIAGGIIRAVYPHRRPVGRLPPAHRETARLRFWC